ncbi:hypothetical protein [Nocardioides sp.]|uniref:hypothetical protein n=1 Tax=Nocardioides sp. TaxID=35761 RepID=UPI00356667DD
MTKGTEPGRRCNTCDTKIIFAKRVGTDRYVPLEAQDRRPFADESAGCLVYLASEAWKPADLIEHFQTRFEVSEDSARELVCGYPWHRIHLHDHEEATS